MITITEEAFAWKIEIIVQVTSPSETNNNVQEKS
jgi:hypothetical protein